MASLHILKTPGTNQGDTIPLDAERVVIGRNPDCDLVLSTPSASRMHAQIVRVQGKYYVEDLGTRNGTFLNNQRVQGRTPLKNNDRIGIADFLAVFLEWSPGETALSGTAEQLLRTLQEGAGEESNRLQVHTSLGVSVEQECRELREALEINHVFYARADATELPRQLVDPGSLARRLLGRGFHRLVVLDTSQGLSPAGLFDLDRFLRHAYQRMVETFGLRIPAESFHAENVSQILKDEPRSLFCFLDVQHIPVTDLRRLRGFTQQAHQVLFLCSGDRDLDREEEESLEGCESSLIAAAVVSRAAGEEDLLDLCNAWHRGADLDSRLSRIASDLLQVYKQADRCLIVFPDAQARLAARVIRTRRAQDQDNARFSRTIVSRCLETGEAFLTDDASQDTSFALTGSIASFQIRSVMSVPLVGLNGTPLGVMQLDCRDRSKKFTRADLTLLRRLADQAATAVESCRLMEEAVQQERLKRDLQLAREVQLSLLPQRVPEVPGYAFHAFYQAAHLVGGDYYDFLPLGGSRWAAVIGDVAGKGVPAAIMMARLGTEVRSCLLADPRPDHAMTRLNDIICPSLTMMDRFITLQMAVLDADTHTLDLVNAGGCLPFLYRAASRSLEEPISHKRSGLALGILEGFSFEAVRLHLEVGDCLVLYTDAIVDEQSASNSPFGLERLKSTILAGEEQSPTALGQGILQSLRQHAGNRPFNDDVTLICLGRTR